MSGLLSKICMVLYRDNVSFCAFFARWAVSRFIRNPIMIVLDFTYVVSLSLLFKWFATFNAFFGWWVSTKYYSYSALAVGFLLPWLLSRIYFCLVLEDKFPVCQSGRCRTYTDYNWALGTWFGISLRGGKICHYFFCNCSHHYLYSGGKFHLLGDYSTGKGDELSEMKAEKGESKAVVPGTAQEDKIR